jgi:hypothetical protein
MSKKIVAFSLLSLCVLLWWCWTQNNNKDNECVDNTCTTEKTEITTDRNTSKTTSEIESDIVGFTENSGEAPVAEKTSWEPIVVEWWGRDS